MTPDQDIRLHALGVIRKAAEALVQDAAMYGIVLTIEQVPRQRPAMGNYDTVVSVRRGHASYRNSSSEKGSAQ